MKTKSIWSMASVFFLIIGLGLFLPGAGVCADKVYKIGIAQFLSVPPLDQAREGFIDAMAEEGFVKGKNVEYDYNNAERDMSVAATIAKKFASQKKDLILSITTPMSQASVAATENTNIPIIFSCVTDPLAAKLVGSWEKPGGRVTGASDWMDVGEQVSLAVEVVPGLKTVGVVWNPGETNSRVQVDELKKAAPRLGFKVIEANAASAADVMAATKSLMGRVQAVWVPTDNVVVGSLEAVVKVCEDHKVPLFGAIASSGMDFYQVGKVSGRMAASVLKGKDPGSIPVAKGVLTDLWINLSAAERMGVTIPESMRKRATKVIK
jgi:putative ABC transport system substrate-binding protein